MCCCIPLRRLSYFGAIMHLMLGLVYFYDLGSVAYSLYKAKDKKGHEERFYIGLMYCGYYAAFLPPGIFIFWGVHKKLRCYLAVPSAMLFVIQMYGVGLEFYYKFRPHWVPDVMEDFNEPEKLNKLRADYWMDISIQVAVTLTYIFMLFFYYREIGPEAPPIQSRYAQAYMQQMQSQQPQQLPPPLPTLGPPPPVPFRPVSQPHSLGASNTNLRNSTPCPPLSFGALNLTYEQQQQLQKLQQHPLILQQLQQQYPMQHMQMQMPHHEEESMMMQVQHPHHQHSHHHQHHQHQQGMQLQQQQHDQVPHPLFHPYAQMMGGGGGGGSGGDKTPKF